MNELLQPVKDVFAVMTGFGWLPVPFFVSVVVMFAARIGWEPPVLAVSTPDDLRRMGLMKLAIFAGTGVVTFLMQYGLQQPSNGFERSLCVGFTLADVCFAYVVTSSQRMKSFIKGQFGGGNAPAA